MFGNGKLRYYAAESFIIASFVGHGLNETFGIDQLLGIDKCYKEVFSCALNAALMGYTLGGTFDLMNYITNYIFDIILNENKKPNELERKVSE